MNTRLVSYRDGNTALAFPLTGSRLKIGREDDNEIQLPHDNVSKHHAALRHTEGGWSIEDLGSVNGVFVNGQRVQRAVLRHGDRVSIGPCELFFETKGVSDEWIPSGLIDLPSKVCEQTIFQKEVPAGRSRFRPLGIVGDSPLAAGGSSEKRTHPAPWASMMEARAAATSGDTEARFGQTDWFLILPAARPQTPDAQEALAQLCAVYWPPLYAFLRKQGRSPEDAKDLTQGFFLHLLSAHRLENVYPAKGKFRSFLLACLQHYVQNEHDKERAQKRGGGQVPLPFDLSDAELRAAPEPAELDDPAQAFERHWAATLIEQVLQKLKARYAQEGKSESYGVLYPFMTGEAPRGGYAEAAARLETSEGAVRVAATRLREEFRELLRAEVGRTVGSPVEIEDEIRYLFRVFRRY
jgi:RNA polymerase sigma factor (sigma-70 family)